MTLPGAIDDWTADSFHLINHQHCRGSFLPFLRTLIRGLPRLLGIVYRRILAGQSEPILLDEPSEGIQPNIVQEIGRIIHRLRQEKGLTVVIVEQNLELIHAVADRCIVMDKGKIIAELTAEEIKDSEVARRYLAIAT